MDRSAAALQFDGRPGILTGNMSEGSAQLGVAIFYPLPTQYE